MSDRAPLKTVTAPFVVRQLVQLCPNAFALRLERKSAAPFDYAAGQFAMVTVKERTTGAEYKKALSFSSTPTDPDVLEFGFEKRGFFTQALTTLRPGDTVTLRAPLGFFVCPPDIAGPLVMLAGGTGISPLLGILRNLHYTNRTNPVTLLYSSRNAEDYLFHSELEQLFSVHENWTLRFTVTQGAPREGMLTGRIGIPMLRTLVDDFIPPLYFLCGPPAMVQELIKALTASGVDRERILTEQYE